MSNGQRAGYRAWDDVLDLWRGAYLSREKEDFLRWPSVADTIYGMILLDQWLDPEERPLPSEAEQISLIEKAETEKKPVFTLPQAAIDYVLCGGSSVSRRKHRIFEQFQKRMKASRKILNFCEVRMALADIPTPFPAAAFVDYDGKGIKLWRGTHGEPDWVEVLLSWAKVEKRIGELIAAGRYLNRAEREQYASYQEQVAEQEARSKIHDDFYGIVCDYKAFVSESKIADKTPDRWYLVSCATAFLNGNKKCMPAPERATSYSP